MQKTFETIIRDWGGLAVVTRYDRPSESWIFIALHDDTLGKPVGGTRLRVCDNPADGLVDAMRLAEGMTHKWAALEFDNGGGKAVLAAPRPLEGDPRAGLLRRYGQLLNSLNGLFGTGRDLGTTDDDMRILGEVTRYVHGVDVVGQTVKDPGPFTARGVYAAIRAVLRFLHDDADSRARRVAVQGIGDVGEPLVRLLVENGARVIVCDESQDKAERIARELNIETVKPHAVFDVECDVFAPCAVGAILDAGTIARLRCRAVAGAANNQLATVADAARLHDRGIVYAPDFVANGGGALAFGLLHRGVTDDAELNRRVEGIEGSMRRILDEAARGNESPLEAAQKQVQRVLTTRRGGPSAP